MNKNWFIWHFLSAIASGWKINPVMGAMYAPELYTGNSDHCYDVTSILHSFNMCIFLCSLCVYSGQFSIPCSNADLGVPGIYAAWPRQSRLQRNSLYCSRTCCCARLPGVRLCPGASTWSTITAESLLNLWIAFIRVVYQDGLYGAEVYVRLHTFLHIFTWSKFNSVHGDFIFPVQGGYPAAYRVAQSASAATATYSDGYADGQHTQFKDPQSRNDHLWRS